MVVSVSSEWLFLAIDAALAYGFWRWYCQSKHTADLLSDAPEFDIGPDLESALKKSPGGSIPYACINGAASVSDQPIKSNYTAADEGIIQHILLQEHRTKRTQGYWSDFTKTIRNTTNTVPFHLSHSKDGDTLKVIVTEPLEAEFLESAFTTTYDKFEPSSSSLLERGMDRIFGDVSKGYQETEEILRVGTNLFGAGELVLKGDEIRLNPPHSLTGAKFILTSLTKAEVVRRLQSKATMYKVVAGIFGAAGVVIIYLCVKKLYMGWREKKEIQRAYEEFRQWREARDATMEEEGVVDDPTACVVCLEQPRDVVLLECGHICVCMSCANALPHPRKCPVCRSSVERVVPTFVA